MSIYHRFVKIDFVTVHWFHLYKDGEKFLKRFPVAGVSTIEPITEAEYSNLLAEWSAKTDFKVEITEA